MFSYDIENDMWWCRHKLSNGQYCMIGFEDFSDDVDKVSNYNVVFAVADKKKQLRAWFENSKNSNITLKSTGRCGVEALFWARDRILDFERLCATSTHTSIIWVTGEDSRRFHLYERALSRYGYTKVPSPWRDGSYGWYMRKRIDNT